MLKTQLADTKTAPKKLVREVAQTKIVLRLQASGVEESISTKKDCLTRLEINSVIGAKKRQQFLGWLRKPLNTAGRSWQEVKSFFKRCSQS